MLNYLTKLNNHSLLEFENNNTLTKATIRQIHSLEIIKMFSKQSSKPNKSKSKVNGPLIVGFQPCHILESENLWRLSKDQRFPGRTGGGLKRQNIVGLGHRVLWWQTKVILV